MEAKQFKAAVVLLKEFGGINPVCRKWASFALKFATEGQKGKLADKFPEIYDVAKKSGNVKMRKLVAATAAAPVPPAAVADVGPGTIVVNKTTAVLGPYGTEAEASREVDAFKHPQVFLYRSGIFPNPQTFGVEATVTGSEVVKISDGNPLKPFGVELVIEVKGPSAKTDSWVDRFNSQARLKMVG